MAREHKGPRRLVKLRLPDVVLELVHDDQAKHEVKELSQFVADLLCLVYDMPELVRELDPGQMQLKLPGLDHGKRDGGPHPTSLVPHGLSLVMVRVPEEVMARITDDRARFGVSSWSGFVSDLLCHVYGRPDLARELDSGEEQLELPIPVRYEPAA